MGILKQHLTVFAKENLEHPIFGDVLTLGQQSVWAQLNEVQDIFKNNGVKCQDIPPEFDTRNKIPHWIGTKYDARTNAHTVFKLLGADNTYVCDASDYENPDFIINLNDPVGKEFYGRFDCIVDVGTLEHVFDVYTALSNLHLMLRKSGKLILVLPASNAIDHGFYMFSPTLFFDFFAENGYSEFSCYLSEGSAYSFGKCKLYKYLKPGAEVPFLSKNGVEVLFFAIKSSDVQECKKPMQSLYDFLYKKDTSTNQEQVPQNTEVKIKGKKLKAMIKEIVLLKRIWSMFRTVFRKAYSCIAILTSANSKIKIEKRNQNIKFIGRIKTSRYP